MNNHSAQKNKFFCVDDELRIFTAQGKKLLCSLVLQQILLYLLPDGSRVNRLRLDCGCCLLVSFGLHADNALMLHRCNLIQKKTVNRQFVFVPGLFKGVDRGEHYLTMKNNRTGCLIISSKGLFLTGCCSTVTEPLYCFQIIKENVLFVILLKATDCLSALHLHLHCLHTHRADFCSPNSQCVRQIATCSNRPSLSEAEQWRVWPLFRCSEEEIKAFDEESPRALLGRSLTVTHECVHVYYLCVWCRLCGAGVKNFVKLL